MKTTKQSILLTSTIDSLQDDCAKMNLLHLHSNNFDIQIILSDLLEDEDLPTNNSSEYTLLDGRNIIKSRYYLKAFTFNEKEFRDYLLIAAAIMLIDDGYENILLVNNCIEFLDDINLLRGYDQTLQDSIWLFHKNLSSRTIDDNSSPHLLKENILNNLQSCIFINSGDRVKSYLKWCIRQYEYTYYESNNLYLYLQPNGIITRKKGLCSMENIVIKNLYHLSIYKAIREWELCISFTEKNKAYEYRYNQFIDGTPVNFAIKNIFSSPYTIADSDITNPFKEKNLLIMQSAIYENKKIIPITSAMQMIYDRRMDLRQAFPSYRTIDRARYADWYIHNAQREFNLSQDYIAPIEKAFSKFISSVSNSKITKVLNRLRKDRVHTKHPFGVNLCGFISGDFGLAEATRLLAKTMDSANIPFTIVSYSGSAYHTRNNNEWSHKVSNEFKYSVNIMLTGGGGAFQFPSVTSPDMYLDRYNIGYWYWELPEFYDAWADNFKYIDEVWTSSEFSKDSFANKTNKPVKVMPLCMNVEVESCSREYFGIPKDKFIFLMMYDVRSIQKRKNPQAAVEAFVNEFKENEDAVLAIKINAPSDWNGENELLNNIAHLKNVITINQTFTKPVVNALIKCCDVYVSLHRSEGLGLGPAESMYLGRPAIMTGWSGNMAYSTPENSCLVDYDIIEIDKDYPPYLKGCHWAEPKVESASKFMRKLFEDKEYYNKIAKNGYKTMHEDFDGKILGAQIKKRLEETQKYISDAVYNNLTK